MNQPPTHIPPPYYEEDEVSLKDIILTVKTYSQEIFRNLYWVILISLLVTGGAYLFKVAKQTTYTTGLSFLVKENEGQKSNSGVSSDLLRLGIGGGIENNKIKELARSSRIINQVLLQKVTIDEKNDFLANHLIDVYEYHDVWNNEPIAKEYQELQLKDFYFAHDNIDTFEPREYRALSALRDLVVGNRISASNGILSIVYDKNTDITRFEVVSLNGGTSLQLIDLIFKELRAFYIEETTGRSQYNYELLAARVDSLAKELSSAQRQLANAADQTYGLVSRASLLKRGQLERDVERINEIYKNLLGKKQEVEYTLNSETPEFMIIDRTFLPIKEEASTLKFLLIGGFLGMFLGLGFIILRKIIRDALAE